MDQLGAGRGHLGASMDMPEPEKLTFRLDGSTIFAKLHRSLRIATSTGKDGLGGLPGTPWRALGALRGLLGRPWAALEDYLGKPLKNLGRTS